MNTELENISPKLEKEIREKISQEFNTQKILLLKDFEIKEKVLNVELVNSREKIQQQHEQNLHLHKQLDSATKKLEDLAEKVVE